MTPGTIWHLTKNITVKGGGVITSYKLNRKAFVRVLVLDGRDCPTEAEQIAMIDAAAAAAKENIRLAYSAKASK